MLARLPGVRAKQLIKALEKSGFVIERHNSSSHVLLRHPATRRTTVVPIHSKELPRWLLKNIIKDSGLGEEQFRSLL
jgi:predicted RNA binding protein YcfA (HicA-like mRNA interferase family)